MPLPVFDAAASVANGEWIVVSGGFTSTFDTTIALQLFHRTKGWRPINSQLWHARARHQQVSLPDGRIMVIGGVRGSLTADDLAGLSPVCSAEVIHPYQARSTLIPLDEPLVGHTVHTLPDGRIAIIGGASIRLFDPRFDRFTDRIDLKRPRTGHASVLIGGSWATSVERNDLPNQRIVIIGGDEEGTIEEVDVQLGSSILWGECLPANLIDAAACAAPDGRLWLTGGFDAARAISLDSTWWLDPWRRTIEPGPALQFEGGVAGHRLFPDPDGRRVYLLGGERREPGRVAPVDSARIIDLEPVFDIWSIAGRGDTELRRAWFEMEPGDPAAAGGYSFLNPEHAARTGGQAGATVSAEIDWLHIPSIALVGD